MAKIVDRKDCSEICLRGCARLREDKYYRYSIVIVRINEITLFGRSN